MLVARRLCEVTAPCVALGAERWAEPSNHPSCEADARPIRGSDGERALTTRQVTHILETRPLLPEPQHHMNPQGWTPRGGRGVQGAPINA